MLMRNLEPFSPLVYEKKVVCLKEIQTLASRSHDSIACKRTLAVYENAEGILLVAMADEPGVIRVSKLVCCEKLIESFEISLTDADCEISCMHWIDLSKNSESGKSAMFSRSEIYLVLGTSKSHLIVYNVETRTECMNEPLQKIWSSCPSTRTVTMRSFQVLPLTTLARSFSNETRSYVFHILLIYLDEKKPLDIEPSQFARILASRVSIPESADCRFVNLFRLDSDEDGCSVIDNIYEINLFAHVPSMIFLKPEVKSTFDNFIRQESDFDHVPRRPWSKMIVSLKQVMWLASKSNSPESIISRLLNAAIVKDEPEKDNISLRDKLESKQRSFLNLAKNFEDFACILVAGRAPSLGLHLIKLVSTENQRNRIIEKSVVLNTRLSEYYSRIKRIRYSKKHPFLALILDYYGRISLTHALNLSSLRIWKGYRDAQFEWSTSTKNLSAIQMVFYNEIRGILEVWSVPHFEKLSSVYVGSKGHLLLVARPLNLYSTDGDAGNDEPQVVFIASNAKMYMIDVPQKLAEE